jgi:menaquinone-dependent protoporphyrinogen oxidase
VKSVLIAFATRHGNATQIARRLADSIQQRGFAAELLDAAGVPKGFSFSNYAAAMIVASVHLGRHEPEMKRFVKARVAELSAIPSAFLSVSLSQAGAQSFAAPPAQRARSAANAAAMIDRFLAETGWHPSRIEPVAGALLYTKYNFVLRFIMKRIAAKAGGSTDVSQDHSYTDWESLDRFCAEFLQQIEGPSGDPRRLREMGRDHASSE